MSERVFSSWKEIAAYLNKSVRTVQRWELILHLPVHRPADHGVILAYQSELDRWACQAREQALLELRKAHEHDAERRARYSEIQRRAAALRDAAVRRLETLRATTQRTEAVTAMIAASRHRRNGSPAANPSGVGARLG